MLRSVSLLLLLLVFASSTLPSPPCVLSEDAAENHQALSDAEYTKLIRAAGKHMQEKDYKAALTILLQILQYRPEDAGCWYNAACCAAILGDKKAALKYLENAFESGWMDFDWAMEDPDLESIRNTTQFRQLMAKRKKYVAAANEKRLEQVSKYYGQHYKVTMYPDDRIILVTDAEEKAYERLLEIIRKVNKNHSRLFRHEPEIYNILLCPNSKEEYNKNYPPMNVLGVFMPATKTLFVDPDVGEGTLVHEYTHALHFADMGALKQYHPIWIIEGFATLYENAYFLSSRVDPRLGFRLMYLNRILDTPAYIPLANMMKYQHQQFMRQAGACYAESRLVMYYLNERGLVKKFYDHYTANFVRDETGISSLEAVVGMPIKEFEEVYKKFVASLGKGLFDTKVSLGVKLTMAALNCLVFEVEEGSPAEKAGILPGDVIHSYNMKVLRASADLTKELAKEKPGSKATIVVMRDGQRITVVVEYPKEEMIPGTGYLGVALAPKKDEEGLSVAMVAKDSPADKSGFRVGDMVIEIENERMETVEDFNAMMGTKAPGQFLRFLIRRDNKAVRVKVKLSSKPKVAPGVNPGV